MGIRAATADDASAIAEVFLAAAKQSWGEKAPAIQPPPIRGGELVAEDDDGITGFAIVKDGEIDLLATHPRVWGRGAGRALVLAAEEALRATGNSEVSLWTEERNAGARRVYRASGWRKTTDSRERVWNGAPLRELRYRKRL